MVAQRVGTSWKATASTSDIDIVVPIALEANDVLVYVDFGNYTSTNQHVTAISSPNTTWRKIAGGPVTTQFWVGKVAASVPENWSLDTTAPSMTGTGTHRNGVVTVLRGVTDVATLQKAEMNSGPAVAPDQMAGNGQVFLYAGYSDNADNALLSRTPSADDWHVAASPYDIYNLQRFVQYGARVATGEPQAHTITATRGAGTATATTLVVGEYDSLVSTVAPTQGLSAYINGAWVERPVKVYKDGAWVDAKVRRYGDSKWPVV